jgi:hypothetical protein
MSENRDPLKCGVCPRCGDLPYTFKTLDSYGMDAFKVTEMTCSNCKFTVKWDDDPEGSAPAQWARLRKNHFLGKVPWDLEKAVEFIRKHQDEALHNGFNLSLGGGVLNSGKSWHDLDIVIAPARGCNGDNIATYLNWFMPEAGLKEVKRSRWNMFMTLIVTKDAEYRKIDLFVVNGAGGVIPPPEWYQSNLAKLSEMPPPTPEEVDQQMKASAAAAIE